MKRLIQIGKELNIGVSTLIDYCERLGHTKMNPHSKIDSQLENQIIALKEGKIEVPPTIENEEFQVLSTTELPEDFNRTNPFQLEQQEIITEGDRFSNRPKRTLTYQDSEVETVFSDFEAYSICMGLDNRHAKHMARNYFKKNEQLEIDQIDAHILAMSALNRYGSKALSFIVSLPPLPFKAVNATQIFSELDKRRKKQEFPILRIIFKNAKNETEKIQISYYAEKSSKGRKRNDNVLAIKNRSTGQQLMLVSRNGIVIPKNNAKQIVPVLQVFIRFSKDTKKAILNYGLETGECSICGRELTVPESIRRGIGPICGKDI